MSKEQVSSETMAEVDEESLKALAVEITPAPEAPREAEKPQEVEKSKRAKVKLEPEPEITDDMVKLKYTGKNPSFTLERYRFVKHGESIAVEEELAAYALTLGYFEEG